MSLDASFVSPIYMARAPNDASGLAEWSTGTFADSAAPGSNSGLLLTGCGSFVCIIDPIAGKVRQLGRMHSSDVVATRWVKQVVYDALSGGSWSPICEDELFVVSGGRDGLVGVWNTSSRLSNGSDTSTDAGVTDIICNCATMALPSRVVSWEEAGGGVAPTIRGKPVPTPVDAVSGMCVVSKHSKSGVIEPESIVVAGASSHGQLCLWHCATPESLMEGSSSDTSASWQLIGYHEDSPTRIVLSCDLVMAPGRAGSGDGRGAFVGDLLLITGGIDGAVRLWTCAEAGTSGAPAAASGKSLRPALKCLAVCSGSTDWIRCIRVSATTPIIDHSRESDARSRSVVIASASNDGKVSLWTVSRLQGEGEEMVADAAPDAAGQAAVSAVSGGVSAAETVLTKPQLALGRMNRPNLFSLGPDESATTESSAGAAGVVPVTERRFSAQNVAVLAAHERPLASVEWLPPRPQTPIADDGPQSDSIPWQPACFVTTSEDASAILWQLVPIEPGFRSPSESSSPPKAVWTPAVRFVAPTAPRQPLCSAALSRCGRMLWAAGIKGSTVAFVLNPASSAEPMEGAAGSAGGKSLGPASLAEMRELEWSDAVSLGGHHDRVAGATWIIESAETTTAGPEARAAGIIAGGECGAGLPSMIDKTALMGERAVLVTVSADYTTRVHGSTCSNSLISRARKALNLQNPTDAASAASASASASAATDSSLWAELARPQIHGHSISCVTAPVRRNAVTLEALSRDALGCPVGCLPEWATRFFSGGEEKVIRAFDPPAAFVTTRAALQPRMSGGGSGGHAGEASSDGEQVSSSNDRLAWELANASVGLRAFRPELGLTNRAVDRTGRKTAISGPLEAARMLSGSTPVSASADEGMTISSSMGVIDLPNRPDGHAPAELVAGSDTQHGRLALELDIKRRAQAEAASIQAAVTSRASESGSAGRATDHATKSGDSAKDGTGAKSMAERFGSGLGSQMRLAAPVGAAPLDSDLCGETLWPESLKLYGHGDSLVSLAIHPSGQLLASTSVARTAAQARLRLWRAGDGAAAGVLEGHESTAIGSSFSGCGSLLATVSRDRHMCVYRRDPNTALSLSDPCTWHWELLARVKAHKRMAWCIAWAPSSAAAPMWGLSQGTVLSDSASLTRVFVTGGREGAVRCWRLEGDVTASDASSLKLAAASYVLAKAGSAVTALEMAAVWMRVPEPSSESAGVLLPVLLCAVGLETGEIRFYASPPGEGPAGGEWIPVGEMPASLTHQGPVRSLKFKPPSDLPEPISESAASGSQLASVGDDGSVRVSAVNVITLLSRAGYSKSQLDGLVSWNGRRL